MAAMSNYLENKLIDHIFRGISYTPPSTVYIGLLTVGASEGASGTEVSGGSYARVAVTANTSNFKGTHGTTSGASSGTSGTTTNAVTVTFPTPTADWGVVTSTAIFDAPSGGNVLFYSPLLNNKTINNGDAAPSFNVDALSIQLDN
jgi:hypothetical protein